MGLTLLDFVLILFFVVYFFSGLRQGFFVALGSIAGFVLGAFAAVYITPWVISQVTNSWYIIAAVISVVGCIVIGQWIGFLLGRTVRNIFDTTRLRGIERVAGAILKMAMVALVILALALTLRPLAIAPINLAMSDSKIVSGILKFAPQSLEDEIASIRTQVTGTGVIPEVQQRLFPTQEAPTEQLANSDLDQARQSVVQILGSAEQCGYTSEGSGFVIGTDTVVTNAHVVAGVENPVIEDADGNSYSATTVYFDATEDIAVLHVANLPVSALNIGGTMPAGSDVVFMGYPKGGPFQSRPATVQGLGYTQTIDAETGSANPSRLVYQLAAQVEQGNSGGPVLDEHGNVVGIIFAKATEGQVGYAIPASVLEDALAQNGGSTSTVDTGQCVQQAHAS